MNPNSSKPVIVCAIGLLAAFFMPWFQMMGLGISGYNLGQFGSYGNYVWIVPILTGATVVLSFSGVNNRGIGIFSGIVPLGFIFYVLLGIAAKGGEEAVKTIFNIAMHSFSIGAWLTIIFSTAIIIAGFVNNQATDIHIFFSPHQFATYGAREFDALTGVLLNADKNKISTETLRKVAQAIAQKIDYKGDDPFRFPLQFLRSFHSALYFHLKNSTRKEQVPSHEESERKNT